MNVHIEEFWTDLWEWYPNESPEEFTQTVIGKEEVLDSSYLADVF